MKLKITIIGPKVHDVGYRPWLTELAMNMALRGFEVYNDEENGQQIVIALIEADEQRIKRFLNAVKTTQPQPAKVSGITSDEYTGDVMPIWQAATIGSFTQLNKAIPILLEMKDDLKAVKKNTDQIPQIVVDLKAVRKTTDATLEEIKGLREDIQPGLAEQLRQMQADIRALKDRAGMP
jgi:acylphosphatase